MLPSPPGEHGAVSAKPHYCCEEVERLARAGRVIATQRVVSWLVNHDYDAAEIIVEVLKSLKSGGRWVGSVELRNGEIADEYLVSCADEDWYLKFCIDEGQVVVSVWSCCWDGVVH